MSFKYFVIVLFVCCVFSSVKAQQIAISNDQYHLYGPNSSWGEYLQVGGNGRVTPYASVASTNGNLHLDSKAGAFAIYLNYYNQGNTYLNPQGGMVGIGTTETSNYGRLLVRMDDNTNQTGIVIKGINNGGIASQPALNFVNGSGALLGGIYGDNGTNYMGFNWNGAERMRINLLGNVGIGTIAPGNRLHVNSTNNGTGATDWIAGNFGGTSGDRVVMGLLYGTASIGAHNNGLNAWSNLAINPDGGNVGIGTIDPSLAGTTTSKFTITQIDDFTGLTIGNSSGVPRFALNGRQNGSWTMFDYASGYHIPGITQKSGNVGIGTTTPTGKLHIAGNFSGGIIQDVNDRPSIGLSGQYPQAVLMSGGIDNPNHGPTVMLGSYDSGTSGTHKHWSIGTSGRESTFLDIGYSVNDLNPHAGIRNYNGSTIMTLLNTGNVGIGTTQPDAKLTVKGKIHAEEVKVDLNVPGPDYVFEKDYDLKSLEEVEKFVSEKKHLPEIPSAKEMKEEGISMGEMQMKLLQKIEELTLYSIEQNKKLAAQNTRVELLEKAIEELKSK